jgi:OOP family OmpA-OmpF porin
MMGAAASSEAQQRLYGGIGVGTGKTPISNQSLAITGATDSSLSKSDGSTAGKIFAGYKASPNLAVEAGYVDLGKTGATRNMTLPSVGSVSLNTRNAGWFADLVGMVPIGSSDFSAIGKIGLVSSETNRNLSVAGTVSPSPGVASSYRDRETNWKYGAGAQYEINKTMVARGEVELYRKLGKESSLGESDVGLFSLNLLIKFQ